MTSPSPLRSTKAAATAVSRYVAGSGLASPTLLSSGETVSVSKLKTAPTAEAWASRRLRSARAGLSSAARSSADAAPTASARRMSLSAVSSSRPATCSSGSTAASPRCQARRSG